MKPISAGLHHVTAMAADPQGNVDFHAGVLGLRLVKRTVNFDDPGTYHLYYGDEQGSPGTLITFFPWPGASRGRLGAGETAATAYRIPPGTAGWWRERLESLRIAVAADAARFGAPVLSFADPDGMRFELIEDAGQDGAEPWRGSPVPADLAIRGLHSVTLASRRADVTAAVLTEMLGFTVAMEADGRRRFTAGPAGAPGIGAIVDLVETLGARGQLGAGSVHHVAFRARDAAHQLEFQHALTENGLRVTEVTDRCYFQSIYFREPGGVLFEVATDPPGMLLDEPVEELGERLQLPRWYETLRPRLELSLPALRVPVGAGVRP
ncbi:MAG: ring-cleaving dioxygenase [Candidatus Eisenbacteria bacterium]